MLNIKDKFMDNKNKLKTPEILKDAFWKLYSKKEISKIRISEITNLAGYNRGVFYLYFKNIYEIKKVFCLGCTVLTNGFNNTQVYAIANSGFSYRIWASYSSTPTNVTFLGGFLVIAAKK